MIAEDPIELRNQGMVVRQRLNLELTDRPRDLCRIELHRVLLLLEVATCPSFRNTKHCGNFLTGIGIRPPTARWSYGQRRWSAPVQMEPVHAIKSIKKWDGFPALTSRTSLAWHCRA